MRIAVVVETFAQDMGYINNTLPKYLARLGAEVHVLTTDLPPYHQLGTADAVFGRSFAERNRNRPGSRRSVDGYTVHTLPHRRRFGYPKPMGLGTRLQELRPDVVCIFQAAGWIPLLCALHRRRLGYQLVIGSHMGKTVFHMDSSWLSPRRVRSFALRTVPGWYIASQAALCVVPTRDCADVVVAHFGVTERLVQVMYQPVDTDFFYPEAGPRPAGATPSNRAALRATLGVPQDEVVCVYSGKFTSEKNPATLAQAIAMLRKDGHQVSGLFIGAGPQGEVIRGAGVHKLPFMPIRELGDYYRASDIGVWTNESISYLDGTCCGLPLLLSDTVKDVSHLREFTAIYTADDPVSLAAQILPLLDREERARRSRAAASLGHQRFAAESYARRRMEQFEWALRNGKRRDAPA